MTDLERQAQSLDKFIGKMQSLQDEIYNELGEDFSEVLDDAIKDMQDDLSRINRILKRQERGE